jgi:hypothetical protein
METRDRTNSAARAALSEKRSIKNGDIHRAADANPAARTAEDVERMR